MFASLAQAWTRLAYRVGDQAINTGDNQDLLNRINSGSYRPAPLVGGEAVRAGGQPLAQAPGQLAAGPGSAGGQAAAAARVPDAAQLREQRLAHFQQQPPVPQEAPPAR